MAHAGVIEGLVRKGFRPELVVGTSMGAIMGALFASGLGSDSIWRITQANDWQEVFAFPRLRVSPDGEAARPFLNLGLGVDRRRFSEGFISDRNVNRLLVGYFFEAGARAHGDFDRLPFRFRPVAADLATGGRVSIARGNLALAVRSSMAVPGVFAPVIDDSGRYLVDGGMIDYLPVKTAHEAGARRVVAVDVIRPPPGAKEALNPFQISIRAFRLTLNNARPEGPEPDVLIMPDIDPDLSSLIFLRNATPLLASGLEAALRQFPDSFVATPRSEPGTRPLPQSTALRIRAVDVTANDPGLAPLAARVFKPLAGTDAGAAAVLRAVDRLDASGFFTGIWPSLAPDGTLEVRADAQPPVIVSAAAGYDADRGARIMAGLRARRGTSEFTLASRLGSLESRASLSFRRPLVPLPSLAHTAGIAYREADIRVFDGERIRGETEVRRAGGWWGFIWTGTRGRAEAVAALRADRIEREAGAEGSAVGFSLRLSGREPNARIVGTPPVLEFERRWGDVAWSEFRARGALAAGTWGPRIALVVDIAASSTAAPADVWPALGQENGIPGLRVGSRRGPVRLIGGLDVAYPVLLEGHALLRLRAGTVAGTVDALDRASWLAGAEAGLAWWTPLGRIAFGAGITRQGDWRATFDIGPGF
jgi:predicted acylesterase/phospholipase RssA